jgi:hypothetical protein
VSGQFNSVTAAMPIQGLGYSAGTPSCWQPAWVTSPARGYSDQAIKVHPGGKVIAGVSIIEAATSSAWASH